MLRAAENLFVPIVGAVEKVGWVELLDVLVVSVILYQLLKLVRGTRAAELIVGLVLLSLVGVVATTLNLILLRWLFQTAAPFVVIAVIVLFQPELRRALDQVGRLSHLNLQLSQFNPQAFNRGIAEAIRAAERGPSITSSLTSSPRWAGRQWRKSASGVSRIRSASTWYSAKAARRFDRSASNPIEAQTSV